MFSLFKKEEKPKQPEWIIDYLGLNFSSLDPDKFTFAVLDCETTGLSKNDSIITIGAIICNAHEIFTNNPLDQRYPLPKSGKASEIHGELAHENEVSIDKHLRELIEFLKSHIIVGHNISFDIGKINQLLQRKFGIKLKNKTLDIVNLAIRLDLVKYERSVGGHANLSLDDLCKEHGINIENRHTALGDAYLTAQLLQRLIYRLNQKGIKKIL